MPPLRVYALDPSEVGGANETNSLVSESDFLKGL